MDTSKEVELQNRNLQAPPSICFEFYRHHPRIAKLRSGQQKNTNLKDQNLLRLLRAEGGKHTGERKYLAFDGWLEHIATSSISLLDCYSIGPRWQLRRGLAQVFGFTTTTDDDDRRRRGRRRRRPTTTTTDDDDVAETQVTPVRRPHYSYSSQAEEEPPRNLGLTRGVGPCHTDRQVVQTSLVTRCTAKTCPDGPDRPQDRT